MQKAIIENTQVFELISDIIGDIFQITVMEPSVDSEKPLPVVYITDANSMLGTACEAVNNMMLGGEIPPVLLVGVGYPVGDKFDDFLRLRTRDFSPTLDKVQAASTARFADLEPAAIECGGALKFTQFLTTELRAFVASKYNIGADATFVGNSMGGLFGTYVLFNKPSAFQRYVLGSPWYYWDYPVSFEYERSYADNNDDLEAIVYMAAGEDEHVIYPGLPEPIAGHFKNAKTSNYARKMFERLQSRDYPNLRFTGKILEGETHFTIVGGLISKGLRTVFN